VCAVATSFSCTDVSLILLTSENSDHIAENDVKPAASMRVLDRVEMLSVYVTIALVATKGLLRPAGVSLVGVGRGGRRSPLSRSAEIAHLGSESRH